MLRPRCSIATLMVAVLYVAVSLAALRSPTRLWASALFSLTLGLLSTAAVRGFARRGPGRAGWIGMATFGLLYTHFAFVEVGYPPLITTPLLDALAENIYGTQIWVTFRGRSERAISAFSIARDSVDQNAVLNKLTYLDLLVYRQIGHSCMAVVAGAVGAIVGVIFSRLGRGSGKSSRFRAGGS